MERTKPLLLLVILFLVSCSPKPTATQVPSATNTPSPTATQAMPLPHITFDKAVTESPVPGVGMVLLASMGDNRHVQVQRGGQDAVSTDGFTSRIRTNYLAFKLEEGFLPEDGPFTIEFDYFDEGSGLIIFQYDSADHEQFDPVYKPVSAGFLRDTREWKTESFVISDAAFQHRQAFGADFRFAAELSPLVIKEIRFKPGGMAWQTPTPPPTVSVPAAFPQPLGDKAVFTYYFYWYSPREHIYNMTDAAVDYKTMDWRDVSWHAQQLRDVAAAGIDVILPIYWYTEYELPWSRPGFEKLVEAMRQIQAEGITPPAVGLFMDTTSSDDKDLRIESEQKYVYDQLFYFFTTLPREYWALAEGNRPVVWFYTSNWPLAYDQTFIDYLYSHFEQDFGVRPYLVFENGWDYPTETVNGVQVKDFNAPRLRYDSGYTWGGAFSAIVSEQIASIGPGYDDHTVEDRIPPLLTERLDGRTYGMGFAAALACESPWVAIETWNEYHEGTDLAESLQYGRQYIDLTRQFVDAFKQGILPPGFDPNVFGEEVVFQAGLSELSGGLTLGPATGDGIYETSEADGVAAVRTLPMFEGAEASYLYFQVDNGFYFNSPQPITLTVSYYDEGREMLSLDYDTAPCASPLNIERAYRRIDLVQRGDTKTWKTISVDLTSATFSGNQNTGADFRLATGITPLTVGQVRISRRP